MKYFTRKLLTGARNSQDKEWMQAINAYREYVSDVLGTLPLPVQEYEIAGFHDEDIIEIQENKKEGTVRVVFGNGDSLLYSRVKQLAYSGASVTDETPNVWLYDELEKINKDTIEFRVLLEDGELAVRAANVQVVPYESR